MHEAIDYSIHESDHAAGLAAVDNGLDEYNLAVGRTWGRCCELQQIWVDSTRRNDGIGRRLMAEFEAEAIRRGCDLCYLDTFDFQAPEFYRKLGYHVALAIDGFGNGFTKYAMHKTLAR